MALAPSSYLPVTNLSRLTYQQEFAMEFRTGDDVVHPNYGVGNIVRLEERELATSGMRWYYVLAIGTATVWMPL